MARAELQVLEVRTLEDVRRFVELCDLVELVEETRVTASLNALTASTHLDELALPSNEAEDNADD